MDGTGENLRPSGAAHELELAENLRPSGAAHELELSQAAAYEAEVDRLPSLGARPSLSERAAENSDGEEAGSGSADSGCRTAEDAADSAAPEAPTPRCGCMNGEAQCLENPFGLKWKSLSGIWKPDFPTIQSVGLFLGCPLPTLFLLKCSGV